MIAVTGGLGFIGNELVRQLMKSGAEVSVIDNLNRQAPRIEDLRSVATFHIDITDHEKLAGWLRTNRVDVLFHLAAIHYIPECNENPERTLRVNVEGTQSVLRAAAAGGVRQVVFASSGAVYADQSEQLRESSPIGPVDIYGQSKWFGEKLCELAVELYGLNVVIARLFNNYGPRETNPHIIPEILKQLRTGNHLTLGRIDTVRDYIHVSDCAEALRRLAAARIAGIARVNVATGQGHTVAELIDILGGLTGKHITVTHDTSRVRKFDKLTQVASIDELIRLTSWRPAMTMREGLRDLVQFEGLPAV